MSASQSVVGFVSDSVAKSLQGGKLGGDTLEIPLEPGKDSTHVRIRHADVAEVRLGPSSGGHTGVQLILKPNAGYEMVVKQSAEDFVPINDLSLTWAWRRNWFVIYAGPIYRPGTAPGTFKAVEAPQ